MSLHLDFTHSVTHWPAAFEKHLSSLPFVTEVKDKASGGSAKPNQFQKPKSGVDYHHFEGHGCGVSKFRCAGIVTTIPPQKAIPGFQRVTMMKWFDPTDTSDSDEPTSPQIASVSGSIVADFLADVDHAGDLQNVDVDIWAYEGIVLPGGKIMLVRNPLPSPPNCGRSYRRPDLLAGPMVGARGDARAGYRRPAARFTARFVGKSVSAAYAREEDDGAVRFLECRWRGEREGVFGLLRSGDDRGAAC